MPEEKSFWTTIPGILTAIGGIIGAVAALVTALYSAGIIGNHQATGVASQNPVRTIKQPGHPAIPPIRLANTSFRFPGDGERNNNRTIGPFCCTGETATIRTNEGTPIGYIYFYDFEDAVNVSNTKSAAGKLKILVSGSSDFSQADASQIQHQLIFAAGNSSKGTTRAVEAGNLKFVATLENAVVDGNAGTRFDMGSVKVRVDVESIRP